MRDRAEKIAGLLIVMAMLPFLLLFSLGQCLADRFPPRRPRLRKAGVLGVAALCMLLVVGTLPVAGCSPATAAQDIVNWMPTLQSVVGVADSTGAVLDPEAAPIFAAATQRFDALSNALAVVAKAYLANPSAGTLAQLQISVYSFRQTVNAALLQAAGIKDSKSQQKALADINAVATVINAIFAIVASISSPKQVAAMAAASTIKLAAVQPYLDRTRAVSMISEHYRESLDIASAQEAENEAALVRAGF